VILCTVCGKGDGKYKCPKCRAPFCCVQCSKDHKANHCTTETADDTTSTNGSVTITNEQSNYLPQKELKINHPLRKRIRRTASDDESEDSHDDEPGWNITPEMKKRVHQSTWLRKELKDGGLRQLIGQIDAASDDDDEEDTCNSKRKTQRNNSTVKISDREMALARTKHSHQKFASFIDQMMLTAGVLQPADGGDDNNIISVLEGGGPGPLVLAPEGRSDAMNATVDSGSSDSDESSDSSDSSDDSDSEGSNSGGSNE